MPPVPPDLLADRAAFLSRQTVSRETLDRLDLYVARLLDWQARTNLVAPSTLREVWTRHVEDSLPFVRLAPQARTWVDLGSGGGFPGLVTAALVADVAGAHVHLVESIDKKAAFLRTVIRDAKLPATVHAIRIEAAGDVLAKADAVSARALASLDKLCGFVAGRVRPGVSSFFAKGRTHEAEIAEASAHWRFDMVKHPSTLEEGSTILELRDIRPLGG